jgi:hypothetical protein
LRMGFGRGAGAVGARGFEVLEGWHKSF